MLTSYHYNIIKEDFKPNQDSNLPNLPPKRSADPPTICGGNQVRIRGIRNMERKIRRIAFVAILSVVLIGISLYSSSEGAGGAAKLIKEAKTCIQEGNKEKAVSTLDAAFESADSAGDCSALMDIGDLYIKIDTSLNEKAMKAWLAAGRWKSR